MSGKTSLGAGLVRREDPGPVYSRRAETVSRFKASDFQLLALSESDGDDDDLLALSDSDGNPDDEDLLASSDDGGVKKTRTVIDFLNDLLPLSESDEGDDCSSTLAESESIQGGGIVGGQETEILEDSSLTGRGQGRNKTEVLSRLHSSQSQPDQSPPVGSSVFSGPSETPGYPDAPAPVSNSPGSRFLPQTEESQQTRLYPDCSQAEFLRLFSLCSREEAEKIRR